MRISPIIKKMSNFRPRGKVLWCGMFSLPQYGHEFNLWWPTCTKSKVERAPICNLQQCQ